MSQITGGESEAQKFSDPPLKLSQLAQGGVRIRTRICLTLHLLGLSTTWVDPVRNKYFGWLINNSESHIIFSRLRTTL